MNDIYNDNTYLQNNPDWHSEDAPFKAKKILDILHQSPMQFDTVCDIGCGSGEILVQLAHKMPGNIQMTGLDIAAPAIAMAKHKETETLKFECKNIADVDTTFDLLLVMDVVEHLTDYFKFLDDITYKGKYTIFHIPLDMCVWSLFREQMLIESKQRVGHIHNFTEDFIKDILKDYGFTIKAQAYTEPSFENMTGKQKIVNTIRKAIFAINKRLSSKLLGGYSILILAENPVKK